MGGLQEKGRLTEQYNAADSARAGTAPGLVSIVDRATRGGQHVFFGEPHAEGMILRQYEILAQNPQLFQVAAKNGVKHLALEFSSNNQEIVDDFVAGEISESIFKKNIGKKFDSVWLKTEEDKKAFIDDFTRTIENAKAVGMKVHFADVNWREITQDKGPPEFQAWQERVQEKHKQEKSPLPLAKYAEEEFEKMPRREREWLTDRVLESGEAERHRRFDDSEQYSYLRGRIPMGEGIMGVVGLGHLDNNLDEKRHHKTMGIDDYLVAEGSKVTTIEMHTTASKKAVDDFYQSTGARKSDLPDFTVLVDRQMILDKDGGVLAKLDKPMPDQKEERYTPYRAAPMMLGN